MRGARSNVKKRSRLARGHRSVKRFAQASSEVQGFCQVLWLNQLRIREIRDCPRHAQDPVEPSGRQSQALHRVPEQPLPLGPGLDDLTEAGRWE